MSKNHYCTKEKALNYLKNYNLKPSSRIVIKINSVSSSGMRRRMEVFTFGRDQNKKPYLQNISHLIAPILDLNYNNDKGLLVNGCGMDMAFWLAQAISSELWGKKKTYLGNGGSCIDWQTI